ncbi:MAG: hypothetical protein ACKVS6_16575 [Planctomycetota bacterium]
MSKFTWTSSLSIFIISGTAGWLAVSGTLPAMRARAAAEAKNTVLLEKKAGLEYEIQQLKAEAQILRTDFQYNRRLERLMFRGAPDSGD